MRKTDIFIITMKTTARGRLWKGGMDRVGRGIDEVKWVWVGMGVVGLWWVWQGCVGCGRVGMGL